jgi:hypothetical protein
MLWWGWWKYRLGTLYIITRLYVVKKSQECENTFSSRCVHHHLASLIHPLIAQERQEPHVAHVSRDTDLRLTGLTHSLTTTTYH